ncbi:hypothetical protein J2X20_000833 [Pelomonas saccharophila]|uniref:Uncharacterized protein n=1 Tax=Roseateles saccharophilus TaxID=304 RepID=A0ABU1YH68_ROSSA|nr:hypothetical protein [Roseateles saccharophilus]MDR7268204.1 hypothetical protein [Roseateles saccharophilus]
MTAPISPLIHALRLLKAELAQARPSPAQGQAAGGASSGLAHGTAPLAAATALQGLSAKLKAARAQSGGALPRSKALRLFVEAALLDELGGDLQLDPALEGLVERTCRAIEQDAASETLLSEALQELQSLAD